MKINIQDTELELWYSMRIYLLWEQSKGRSMAQEDLTSFSTLVDLFYFTVVNTYKHNNEKFNMTYDEFLDWVDENGSITIVNLFGFWFADQIKHSAELASMMKHDEEPAPEEDGKKKRKQKKS